MAFQHLRVHKLLPGLVVIWFQALYGRGMLIKPPVLEVEVFNPCRPPVLLLGVLFELQRPSEAVPCQTPLHRVHITGESVVIAMGLSVIVPLPLPFPLFTL